jgi:predicted nuclease with TOPRIM domain
MDIQAQLDKIEREMARLDDQIAKLRDQKASYAEGYERLLNQMNAETKLDTFSDAERDAIVQIAAQRIDVTPKGAGG